MQPRDFKPKFFMFGIFSSLHSVPRQNNLVYTGMQRCKRSGKPKVILTKKNDPYTHFSVPQQADVAGNILLLFYKKKRKQNKKIIKYYQPRQLVVGLL
jgi:hypothetical protein